MISNTSEMSSHYRYELRKRIIPDGRHYNFRFPWQEPINTFVKGVGTWVTDVDNQTYMDFYAQFGAGILGHAHSDYTKAIQQSIAEGVGCIQSAYDITAAEAILDNFPHADMVRFCVTGTEAVQNAIRLARAYTGRERFLRFEGHYHGHSENILGGKCKSIEDPIPVSFPEDLRYSEGLPVELQSRYSLLIPWNDFEVLESVIQRYGQSIACIITEPICMNGGGISADPKYLFRMRELCDQYGILLIFDEIITGFRVSVRGAQDLFSITPDITCLGKAMGGGLVPISAIIARKDIMSLIAEQRVVNAGTFNGYMVGLAAVCESINILSRDNSEALCKMHALGRKMRTILKETAMSLDLPLITQGHDGCFYYHCTDCPITSPSQWSSDLKRRDIELRQCLFDAGVITAPPCRFYPSIALVEDDLNEFEARARKGMISFRTALR